MPFMERLHSSLILKTTLHHSYEADILEHPHKSFYHAIRSADKKLIIKMIYEGFDIDYHGLAQTPPLIYAIAYHRDEIIQLLLLHGADTNIMDKDGNSPLHLAITLQQDQILHLLLRYGANPHQKNSQNNTPYDLARENPSLLSTLENTASMLSSKSQSLFDYAKDGDLISIVNSILLTSELFKKQDTQSLLQLSVLGCNPKLTNYLLNKNLNIDDSDKNGITALIIASIHSRYLSILKLLIQRNATLEHKTNNGSSALSMALRNGNYEGVQLLINSGANIHIFDALHTPLTLCHMAIKKFPKDADEFRKIQTLLLEKGAHVDISTNLLKWTPLFHTASKYQDPDIMNHLNLLLQYGADVNIVDINGRTPLMLASSTGRLDAVKALLNNYSNTEKLDSFGWSALMFSVYYNHFTISSFLLEYGCNVNLTSDNGLNAYKLAVKHQRKKILKLLVDFGANDDN